MTNERYDKLMSSDDELLTPEEIADNWHFCADFDGLLTQGEIIKEDSTCICGCKFPKQVPPTPPGQLI